MYLLILTNFRLILFPITPQSMKMFGACFLVNIYDKI
jgi:hypothetical protein